MDVQRELELAQRTLRAHRGEPDLRVRIVDRLDQRVPRRLDLQAADDARRPGADRRIVVVERFHELRRRILRQRRTRDESERVDRLETTTSPAAPYMTLLYCQLLRKE